MRGDVAVLSRMQSRDRRLDLICQRLQRKPQNEGTLRKTTSDLSTQPESTGRVVWPVRPKMFWRGTYRAGESDEYRATIELVKMTLINYKIARRHAYIVSEVPGGVFVAPKRKLASNYAHLLDAILEFGAKMPSTHSVPLFHMADDEISTFTAFDAPGGAACLGVVELPCQDNVTLYALCDAMALPYASTQHVDMDATDYKEIQTAVAHTLRLVATPCPHGHDGFARRGRTYPC